MWAKIEICKERAKHAQVSEFIEIFCVIFTSCCLLAKIYQNGLHFSIWVDMWVDVRLWNFLESTVNTQSQEYGSNKTCGKLWKYQIKQGFLPQPNTGWIIKFVQWFRFFGTRAMIFCFWDQRHQICFFRGKATFGFFLWVLGFTFRWRSWVLCFVISVHI